MTARSITGLTLTLPQVAWSHLWGFVLAMAEVRRSRQMLLDMEPRMLADIGISRGEARAEAARAMWDLAPARR